MKKILTSMAFLMLALMPDMNAQTSVTTELDSAQILIGDQAVLSIKITSPGNVDVQMPVYKEGDMLSNGVEIVEIDGDTTDVGGNQRQIVRNITITSWDEGTYAIEPQSIAIAGKKYTTDRKILKVLTMEVDTLHPEQIKPTKDVMDNPFSLVEWLRVVLRLIVTVVLIILFVWLRRLLKSKKRLFPGIRRIKKLLPHEKALMSIEKIKEGQLSQSLDQKTYYTQLTDTLRVYLEERFAINAKEMTSGEIVDRLMAEEDVAKVDELRELFMTADLVKFAKYSTPNTENAMYLANVARFVEDTKREDVPQVEPSDAERLEEERLGRLQRRGIRLLMAVIAIAALGTLVCMVWQIYELLM